MITDERYHIHGNNFQWGIGPTPSIMTLHPDGLRVALPVTRTGTGAVSRTIESKLNEIVSVFDFFTEAQRADVTARTALVNVATEINTAITYAVSVGAILNFPPGIYLQGTTTVVWKNNGIYQGSGKDTAGSKGTLFKYTGTSDAQQINNPINSSTAANIVLRDFAIQCTVDTANKACLADTGSTFLTIQNVGFIGADRLLILDQSELVNILGCQFELGTTAAAGIWIVNGATRSVGASLLYSNRINIEQNNQFNGTSGVCIADDGGASHRIVGNNFNACTKHIRATWVYGLVIDSNESEAATSTHFDFPLDRLDGGTATDPNSFVTISNNFFSTASAIAFMTITTGAILRLTHHDNHCNGANAGSSIWSNLAAGALECVGWSTFQFGTGSAVNGNTLNTSGTYTPAWASDTIQPALGNGTITGQWTRNGTAVTLSITLTPGNTTTFGTGPWYFDMPFSNASPGTVIGSAYGADSVGGVYRAGVTRVLTGVNTVRAVTTGGGNFWKNDVPHTWANGDTLTLTITYQVADNWLP